MSKEYWLWQAECAYEFSKSHPHQNWERHMYFLLFKAVGFDE